MITYTGGTFDLFHAGHVFLLRECAKLAGDGEVVVALNTDAFCAAYKGSPPVASYEEREAVLLACRYVDKVVPNIGGADSKPTLLQVMPDWLAIGQDWALKDYYAQMQITPAWLHEQGISLVYLPRPTPLSTTALKERMHVA